MDLYNQNVYTKTDRLFTRSIENVVMKRGRVFNIFPKKKEINK